jgi:Domain of unknown function (DUF5658)
MVRVFIWVGCIGALLDAYTTWLALGQGGGYYEANPFSAWLMGSAGLFTALAIATAVKLGVFAVVGALSSRYRRMTFGAFVLAGVMWMVVLSNVASLSQ